MVVAISAPLGRTFFSRALPMIVIVAIALVVGVLIGASCIGGVHAAPAVLPARLVALPRVLAGVIVVVRSGHTRVEPW